MADEDVYDSRKNRTDRWSLEEPAWQKAKYIVGHVTTLGLGLEVPYTPSKTKIPGRLLCYLVFSQYILGKIEGNYDRDPLLSII